MTTIVINDPSHQPPTVVIVNGGVCTLHGPDQEPLCVWCMEPAGTCTLTRGAAPCEGLHKYYADQLAAASAPRLPHPIHGRGA